MDGDRALVDRWSLVNYVLDGDPREHVGMLGSDSAVYQLPELSAFNGLMPALDAWPEVSSMLRSLSPIGRANVPRARILAPLRFPRKILCAGANYWSHLREMGGSPDSDHVDEPYFFLIPATAIVGPDEPIQVPNDERANVDWEGELAVVVGRPAHNISADQAPAHVAGYTICNDVSARGFHRRASFVAPPFEWDWLSSKGRDSFLPLGPSVMPFWFVEDPHDLFLRVWVNGALKQDGSTSDLIVDVWELVAAASTLVTLEPGDLITTGTPAGVGAPRGEYLRPGDLVTVEIEGLGQLSNPVRAEVESRLVVETMPGADGEP